MDRVAQLVKQTRDETFLETIPPPPGGVASTTGQPQPPKRVMMTPAIFSLGGATIDNEWNHIQQKLLRGLGVIAIENQARI
jgi:formate dehydrogenase major subunit